MTSGMKTVVYPVADIAAAKQLYSKLFGVTPYADEAYYVGFNVGGQDVALDPNGQSRGMTGPVGYWHVADIASGAQVREPARDVGGGKLIATLADADGNPIGLLQEPARS